MRKFIAAVSTMILMVLGGVILFMDHCVHPTEMQVVMIQLQCAKDVNVEEFVREACYALHGSSDCQLEESDREKIGRLFLDKVNACTLATLKEQKMCVDKYEAM